MVLENNLNVLEKMCKISDDCAWRLLFLEFLRECTRSSCPYSCSCSWTKEITFCSNFEEDSTRNGRRWWMIILWTAQSSQHSIPSSPFYFCFFESPFYSWIYHSCSSSFFWSYMVFIYGEKFIQSSILFITPHGPFSYFSYTSEIL